MLHEDEIASQVDPVTDLGWPAPSTGWDAMDDVMDDNHTDSADNMPGPGAGWGATGGHMSGSAGMSMGRR
jgi:hypothetical protein